MATRALATKNRFFFRNEYVHKVSETIIKIPIKIMFEDCWCDLLFVDIIKTKDASVKENEYASTVFFPCGS